jgi:hypothetical protein
MRGAETLANGDQSFTLICRRSLETNSHVETRKERLVRTHGSVKLDENCLSRFKVLMHPDGSVSATYYNRHTGHHPSSDHFNVLRLGRSVLQTIDKMLLDGIPYQRIMKDLNAALRDRDTRDDAFQVPSAQSSIGSHNLIYLRVFFRPLNVPCL